MKILSSMALAAVLVVMAAPAMADPVFMPLAMAAFYAGAPVAVANAIIGVGVLGTIASAVGTIALGIVSPARSIRLRGNGASR